MKLTELALFIIPTLLLRFNLSDPVHQDDTSTRPPNSYAFPDIFSRMSIWHVVSPLETGPPRLPSRTRIHVTLLLSRRLPSNSGSPNNSFFDPTNLVNHVEDIPGIHRHDLSAFSTDPRLHPHLLVLWAHLLIYMPPTLHIPYEPMRPPLVVVSISGLLDRMRHFIEQDIANAAQFER